MAAPHTCHFQSKQVDTWALIEGRRVSTLPIFVVSCWCGKQPGR